MQPSMYDVLVFVRVHVCSSVASGRGCSEAWATAAQAPPLWCPARRRTLMATPRAAPTRSAAAAAAAAAAATARVLEEVEEEMEEAAGAVAVAGGWMWR